MKNYIPESLSNLFFEDYLTLFVYTFGGLAHLARALRWQRRGDRFESDILHNIIFSPFIDLKGLFYAQKRTILR